MQPRQMRETFIPVEPNRTYSITLLPLNIFNAVYQSSYLMKFSTQRPTSCVSRKWAGRDNATLTDPASSRENCLKTRRIPAVQCALCYAAASLSHDVSSKGSDLFAEL